MENNFKCPKTGKEFFFAVHRTVFDKIGNKTYKDQSGNILVNPDNNEPLEYIPKKVIDYSSVGFTTSGKEGKQKMIKHLQKRSKDHFKKEIQEKKDHIIKTSTPK